MIVVRRMFLNRLPQYSRPAPNTTAMRRWPSVIWFGSKPCMQDLVGEVAGSAFENWKSDWLNHSPIEALIGDPGRRQQQTCDDADERADASGA